MRTLHAADHNVGELVAVDVHDANLPPDAGFRRATVDDLDPDPVTAAGTMTRLDWVGRNHGKRSGYPDRRKTNFLYVDGHVVTKTIYQTLEPFEWGEQFYGLVPNSDLRP